MFLRGVVVDGDIKNIPNPDNKLISDKTWKYVLNLECISSNIEGLCEKIDQSLEIWKTWIKCDDPTELPLPNNYDFNNSIVKFVERTLGKLFANPMPVVMEEVYKDSDNKIPIIFVLTVGADP